MARGRRRRKSCGHCITSLCLIFFLSLFEEGGGGREEEGERRRKRKLFSDPHTKILVSLTHIYALYADEITLFFLLFLLDAMTRNVSIISPLVCKKKDFSLLETRKQEEGGGGGFLDDSSSDDAFLSPLSLSLSSSSFLAGGLSVLACMGPLPSPLPAGSLGGKR